MYISVFCFVLQDHKSPVTCVTYNYNDSYVASGAENGDILLNNVTTGQGCAPLRAPKVQVGIYQNPLIPII